MPVTSGSQPAYRWVILAASAAMLAVAMGVMVNGLSVFVIPLSTEFGWQRGAVSLINVAGLAGLALGGVVMGQIADRTTTRRVCLFGSFVFGLCILLASRAETLRQFYLLFFLAGFLGAGALFAPVVANVGKWFSTGAGLALGIASAGQALGQGGVPFATAILITSVGWRGTLATMGVIAMAILFPLAMLIRQAPVDRQTAGAGISASDDDSPVPLPSSVVTAWLSLAVVFCCTCMSVPLMHLVPLLQDHGFSPQQSSSVLFLMLAAGIAGRIFFGKLADVIGALPAYMFASLWQTALVFLFVQFSELASFYVFAAIYGFGYSGVMTGILVCVRVLTPLARRASALGIVTVFAWLGHGIGGYQGGFFFDLTGAYTVSYANAALAGVVNLIIVGALHFTIARRRLAPSFAR
jgi:MFS family permease